MIKVSELKCYDIVTEYPKLEIMCKEYVVQKINGVFYVKKEDQLYFETGYDIKKSTDPITRSFICCDLLDFEDLLDLKIQDKTFYKREGVFVPSRYCTPGAIIPYQVSLKRKLAVFKSLNLPPELVKLILDIVKQADFRLVERVIKVGGHEYRRQGLEWKTESNFTSPKKEMVFKELIPIALRDGKIWAGDLYSILMKYGVTRFNQSKYYNALFEKVKGDEYRFSTIERINSYL